MTETSQADIASTMPVPERTPVRTAAAMTIETTAMISEEWAVTIFAWSQIFGKFTIRAMAEPTMNRYGSGTTSRTRVTMMATVSARLNQNSLGRRVERFGSSALSARDGASSTSLRSSSSTATWRARSPMLPAGAGVAGEPPRGPEPCRGHRRCRRR